MHDKPEERRKSDPAPSEPRDLRDQKARYWNVEPPGTATFNYRPTPPSGPRPEGMDEHGRHRPTERKRPRSPRPSRQDSGG